MSTTVTRGYFLRRPFLSREKLYAGKRRHLKQVFTVTTFSFTERHSHNFTALCPVHSFFCLSGTKTIRFYYIITSFRPSRSPSNGRGLVTART